MLRVLICGDRKWQNSNAIQTKIKVLLSIFTNIIVIEGEAPGADSIARDVAKKLGVKYLPFPAKWTEYGKKAGPIRNRQMLKEGKPDLVLAFHSNLKKSIGTADMVRISRKAGVPVWVSSEDVRLQDLLSANSNFKRCVE